MHLEILVNTAVALNIQGIAPPMKLLAMVFPLSWNRMFPDALFGL